MSDEQFEEFLKREAQAYNAPPAAVPRDEMWSAIRARRTPKRRYGPWIGMAATLLLGVGIGRFALDRDGATNENVLATAPVIPLATSSTRAADSIADAIADAVVRRPPAPGLAVPATGRRGTRIAANRPATNSDGDAALQIMSREHLSRAEALVSVVAATPADAAMDSLTGRWARDMLTNTRLLLDSPAGNDPVRRRLFEDLETVLVQLIQRTGGAVDERQLIDRTLERTQLLTRLRNGAAGI